MPYSYQFATIDELVRNIHNCNVNNKAPDSFLEFGNTFTQTERNIINIQIEDTTMKLTP